MKPSDLRIGNNANFMGGDSPPHTCKIIAITQYNIECELIDEGEEHLSFHQQDCLSQLQPILLTEEWLKSLGFEENEYGLFKNLSDEFRPSCRWITHKFMVADEEIKDPFLRFDGLVDIHYVHQLQNLYFALIGKNLTIKESINA